jgi:site-specific recombinase XerD
MNFLNIKRLINDILNMFIYYKMDMSNHYREFCEWAATKEPKKVRQRVKRNKRKCIEKHIFEFLLNEIDRNDDCCEKHVVFNKKLLNVMLYYTGLRTNEVLLLCKKDYVRLIKHGKLDVYCKKTGDYRTVFLQGATREKFLSHFPNIDLCEKIHTLGLVNQWNKKLQKRAAERWMYPYFDLLEEKYGGQVALLEGRAWGLHSYRVNFINQIIRSADLDTASKLIGHKNPSTTLIYFRKLDIKEEVLTGIIDSAKF